MSEEQITRSVVTGDVDGMIAYLEEIRVMKLETAGSYTGNSSRAREARARLKGSADGLAAAMRALRDWKQDRPLPVPPIPVQHEHDGYAFHVHVRGTASHAGVART